jgi:hypothetical protein
VRSDTEAIVRRLLDAISNLQRAVGTEAAMRRITDGEWMYETLAGIMEHEVPTVGASEARTVVDVAREEVLRVLEPFAALRSVIEDESWHSQRFVIRKQYVRDAAALYDRLAAENPPRTTIQLPVASCTACHRLTRTERSHCEHCGAPIEQEANNNAAEDAPPACRTQLGTERGNCVRCGAPYTAWGQCSRYLEGCQGGWGENQGDAPPASPTDTERLDWQKAYEIEHMLRLDAERVNAVAVEYHDAMMVQKKENTLWSRHRLETAEKAYDAAIAARKERI